MTVRGQVERRLIGRGTKSAHNAVVLVTRDHVYILRRRGGHAFQDPALDALVGKELEFEGEVHDNVLHVSKWKA